MGLAALRQRKHYSEEGVMTQRKDRRQHEGRGNEGVNSLQGLGGSGPCDPVLRAAYTFETHSEPIPKPRIA